MANLIDFAGLFPPARLSMNPATEAYARAREGEHEWMLGRFICPAGRLEELSAAAAAVMPGTYATSGYRERVSAGEPWRVSVIIESPAPETIEEDLERIARFNQRHSREEAGLAEIDTIELRSASPEEVDYLIEVLPEELFAYVEVPVGADAPGGDCRGFVASLAGTGLAAKIRTGGVKPAAIPAAADVAEFLRACVMADVPFKATAGLHHPVRSLQRLDTTPDAPSGVMHGFLNVFIAAALVRACEIDRATTVAVLEETQPGAFRFTETAAAWRDHQIEAADLARVRETLALCFGSCSFEEPVADLKAMGAIS